MDHVKENENYFMPLGKTPQLIKPLDAKLTQCSATYWQSKHSSETFVLIVNSFIRPYASELDALVSEIHLECVGESRSVLSTLDKLKRIELKMEHLTRELEQMPQEKVRIAQKVSRQ